MTHWLFKRVPLKFQLGDLTLFSASLPLQIYLANLRDGIEPCDQVPLPSEALAPGSEGYLLRGIPLAREAPVLRREAGYLFYTRQQYQHCFINLDIGFERYQEKFSSKTRSTIQRKIRKFTEFCGGQLHWKTYRTQAEVEEFLALATSLSKSTYQDRLLDAGLPDNETFRAQARERAQNDQVRAYLLFHGDRPVSYLYCPAKLGVLNYAHVGYHPDYMHLSVGTVLQWLALEQLFNEKQFHYFDFTEGTSDHKRLFATDQRLCAVVYIVRNSLRNAALIRLHLAVDRFSAWLGPVLERWGVKARVKRLLRFSLARQA